jgi:hypothetical protein
MPKKSSRGGSRKLYREQLFHLEKNDLKPYGYENVRNKSVIQRHRALSRALNDLDSLSLSRKLNALAVVNKNRNPSLSRAFKYDSEWVKTTKQYQNRPISKRGSKKGSKRGSKKGSKRGSKKGSKCGSKK